MAWLGLVVARGRGLLSHAATPPRRGNRLPAPTWSSLPGADRAYANRLRARRLPARLAVAVGLPAPDVASSRFGNRLRIRRLYASCRVSARGQPLWPQPVCRGAASPFLTGSQGWLVLVGASPSVSGGHSRRRAVRLCRVVAGRLSQRYLRDGNSAQRIPVSSTVRWYANHLS